MDINEVIHTLSDCLTCRAWREKGYRTLILAYRKDKDRQYKHMWRGDPSVLEYTPKEWQIEPDRL